MTYSPILKTLTALALVGFLAACESSEERAEGHYQSALSLMEEGDTERALVELRNVFDLDGSHLEARQLYAKTMRDLGRFQDAYGQYLRLAEQAPDDAEARIALAEMAMLGRPRNWHEQLRVHSARAVVLAPDDPRAQALSAVSDFVQAELSSNRAAMASALERVRDLVKTQPDNGPLLEVLLSGHVRDGNMDAALETVDRLRAQSPNDPRLSKMRRIILWELGDMDAVEAHLKDSVQRFENDLDAKRMLYGFYVQQGAPEKAEAFLRSIADPAAEDPVFYIDLVRFVAEQRGFDAAIAELDSVIGTVENENMFKALRTGYMFDKGDREEAIDALQAVIADSEPSAQRRNWKVALARFLLVTRNEVGARQLIEQVLADDPSNVEALKVNVDWQLKAGAFDEAIASLRTVLEEAPEDIAAMELMSRAYLGAARVAQAADPERAELLQAQAGDYLSLAVDASENAPRESIRYAAFLVASGQLIPAEQTLVASLRKHENNADLLGELGKVYVNLDDRPRLGQTIADLKKIDGEKATRAAAALETILIERTRGTDEAIAFLEGVANNSESADAVKITLIQSRLRTGDFEAALATAQSMLDEDPEDPNRRYLMATTQSAAGQLDAAKANYEALLALAPKNPALYLQLIRVSLAQGDAPAGAAWLEKGLEATSNAPSLLRLKAEALDRERDFDGAIKIYEELYTRNPDDVIVANNLASLLTTHRGDAASFERAAAVAGRLRGIPQPAFQDTWGWIALNRGDLEEALAHLEPAAQGIPGDAIVQYHLGRAYEAAERVAEARAQYAKVLELAEANGDTRPQVADARTRLEALPAE